MKYSLCRLKLLESELKSTASRALFLIVAPIDKLLSNLSFNYDSVEKHVKIQVVKSVIIIVYSFI